MWCCRVVVEWRWVGCCAGGAWALCAGCGVWSGLCGLSRGVVAGRAAPWVRGGAGGGEWCCRGTVVLVLRGVVGGVGALSGGWCASVPGAVRVLWVCCVCVCLSGVFGSCIRAWVCVLCVCAWMPVWMWV